MHLTPVRPSAPTSARASLRAAVVAGVAVAVVGIAAVLVPAGPGATLTPGDPRLESSRLSAPAAGSLSATLLTADKLPAVSRDLQKALEDQVDAQGGVVSMTYDALETISPGLSRTYIRVFLPGFLRALEPEWQAYRSGAGAPGADFGAFLASRPQESTDAMLKAADKYASIADRPSVIAIYRMARPVIAGSVTAALPAIGHALEQNM